MYDLKKLLTIGVFTLFILCGTLGGVFGVNNSVNNTSKGPIQPLISLGISVSPTTLNLGSLMPDGSETSFMSRTNVSVTGALGVALYVKASGDFISGGNNIPLSNFKYAGFDASVPKTAFTTSPVLVRTWSGLIIIDTVPANYYLTVPTGTQAGNYSVTITYSASLL